MSAAEKLDFDREVYELKRAEARRANREATNAAIADLMVGLAQGYATTALLHPDVQTAAEAFAKSQDMVMRAGLVRAGLEVSE